MSSIRLNQNKKWQQSNSGELFGNIMGIYGCDLDSNSGKIRISPQLSTAIINSGTITTFTGFPSGMVFTNAGETVTTQYRWWIMSNNVNMFKDSSNTQQLSFVIDAKANTPTDPIYDMTVFSQTSAGYDNLIVSRAGDLARLNNNSWNQTFWTGTTALAQPALSSTDPHPVEPFLSQYGSFCLVGDGNKLHTFDTTLNSSGVRNTRVQLENKFRIIWIRSTDTRIFIGTRNANNGRARIFEYDPVNENIRGYEVSGSISMAGTVKNNIPYSIDNQGIVYKYNGNGFSEIGYLPVYYLAKEVRSLAWSDGSTFPLMVFHRGMAFIGKQLHVLLGGIINNNNSGLWETMPSGIWVLDEESGNFYCKYRLGTINSGDYGQEQLNSQGAAYSSSNSGAGFLTLYQPNSFFAGYQTVTGDASGTARNVVAYPTLNSTGFGRFITPKIYSPEIQSNWNELWLIFKKLENSTDKIVVKYRVKERFKTYYQLTGNPYLTIQGTWSAPDSFNTTDANFADAQVGDEIEVIRGSCGGQTAHISSINLNAGTYTVVLDETIISTGDGTGLIQVHDWIKLDTFSTTNLPQYADLHFVAASAEWIQFKVELRGTHYSPEIDDLIVEFQQQLKTS